MEQDTEEKLRAKLERDGYDTSLWEDDAGTTYPAHSHPYLSAHIVLAGEMSVTSERRTTVLKAGDRRDIPTDVVHSAIVGPAGCRYMVGRKKL